MRLEHPGRLFAARPPHESPLRQPFLRQPEPLAVIDQDTDRGPATAPEYKQASREGICPEFVLAQPGERIDALPAIDRLDRNQDAHLRCDLDHADSHNDRLSPARSGAVAPFHWMRILPRGPSNSIRHSVRPGSEVTPWGAINSKKPRGAGAVAPFQWLRLLPRGPSISIRHSVRPGWEVTPWGAINSKKPAGAGASLMAGLADATMRFSLPCSRRKILAVRNTPCSRATAAAAAHNAAGIGKRPRCDFRQRSKRR